MIRNLAGLAHRDPARYIRVPHHHIDTPLPKRFRVDPGWQIDPGWDDGHGRGTEHSCAVLRAVLPILKAGRHGPDGEACHH